MAGTRRDGDVVKKASSVVMARYCGDVEFKASDQSLFNYLLLRAYDDIVPGAIHQIPVKEALEGGRFDRVSLLQEAIERLGRGLIEIDYKEGNEERSLYAHFLSADTSKSENGIFRYAFDPILVHFLRDPKVFSLLRSSTSQALAKKPLASSRLYEAMALQFHKKTPVWKVTVDELREFLRIGDQYKRFDNFRAKVIERCIEDVNAVAEFDVLVDYTRGGKGGSVTEIEFTAVSKSHSRLMEARSTKFLGGKGRNPSDIHTIDMLDGKTREERGGPAELRAETVDAARGRVLDGEDIGALIMEWREEHRGRAFDDPDRSFLRWLDLRNEKRSDPLFKDLDGDIFGQLLEGGN